MMSVRFSSARRVGTRMVGSWLALTVAASACSGDQFAVDTAALDSGIGRAGGGGAGGSAGSDGGGRAGGAGGDATGGMAGASGAGGSGVRSDAGSGATPGSGGADASTGDDGGGSGGLPGDCVDDADCDNDNVCDGDETCVSGRCVAGDPLACAEDDNDCTVAACDRADGCYQVPVEATCDDGSACTSDDQCNSSGECRGTPKDCAANEICDPESGECVCKEGTIRCDGVCKAYFCCPGSTAGACGRCGTRTCRDNGSGYDCLGEHGNCDPGWSCTGVTCQCPDGPCACSVGERRECIDCTISGCF